MEQTNWWLIPAVAFIPLIVGFIWYHPAVFGKPWMQSAEISEERAQSGNMVKIFALTYLFSFFAAYLLALFAIHQTSIYQLLMGDASLANADQIINDFMIEYGDRHRSFSHGALHGFELALLTGLSFIGIPAMFERRPFKYTMIHTGFWIISFVLMGGILCAGF